MRQRQKLINEIYIKFKSTHFLKNERMGECVLKKLNINSYWLIDQKDGHQIYQY